MYHYPASVTVARPDHAPGAEDGRRASGATDVESDTGTQSLGPSPPCARRRIGHAGAGRRVPAIQREMIMGRYLTGFGAAVLVVVAVFCFTSGAPTGAQEKKEKGSGQFGPPRPVQWEYRVFHSPTGVPDEVEFNKLGADGWELATSFWRGAPGPSVHTFKRPK